MRVRVVSAFASMLLLAASAEAPTPLSLHVSCAGTKCSAWARGGSGSYTGFEWSLADETFEGTNGSGADASAYCVSGLVLGVDATVTDSNGATAVGSAPVFCP